MTLNSNSFLDVTSSAGINWSRHRGDEAFSIAWIDYNNDGLLDLWHSGHGYNNSNPRNPTGKFPFLYINDGDGTFTNLFTEDWRRGDGGDTHGTTWIDFDNDGDLDVFVSGGGELGEGEGQPNLFFVNNGGTLEEEAVNRNLEYRIGRTRSTTWLDVNGDSRLDAILLTALRDDGQGDSAYFQQNPDGTFQDPVSLDLGGNSRYAQLGDLNGDGSLELVVQGTNEFPIGVFDVSDNSLQNITDQFGFPLTFEPPNDIAPDFFNRTSAKDSIIADFDNDGDNDFFLTRSDVALRNTLPSVFQSGDQIIGAELLNEGREIGFSFQTSGEIALDIFDMFEREPELSASEIFIGSLGRNPTSGELAAFSETDTDTSVNLLGGNTDRPSLVLSPDSSDILGIQSDRSTRGIYVGYNDESETWQVRLSSDSFEILRAVVESTAEIDNLNPINFSNPDPNVRALSDQLWLNDSNTGNFVNSTASAGLNFPTLSQSTVAGDFDNDKDLDIYVANTFTSINQPNLLYDNQGDGTFDVVSQAGGAAGTEFGPLHLDFNMGSRLATGDYDRDGFLDIFAGSTIVKSPRKTYLSTPLQLFQNQGNDNNWIQLDLEGTESNRDGIGAQVRLTSGGVTQLREQNGGLHAFAQNSPWLHFGLGNDSVIEQIEIRWSSGNLQTLNNVAVNQVLSIQESEDLPNDSSDDELVDIETNDTLANSDRDDTITDLNDAELLKSDLDNILLEGSNDDDVLDGGEGEDTLIGNNGNDLIYGQGGFDLLEGGDGDDTIRSGDGDDTIIGGAGIDVLEEQIDDDVTIFNDRLLAGGTDFLSEIEIVNIETGDRANVVDASAVTNLEVTIQSSDGDDTLIGGSQDDTFTPGLGIDVITGGEGADDFVYQNIEQRDDLVTDFEPGQDKILISAASFEGGLTPGNIDDSQFKIGSTSESKSDRFLYDTNNGKLSFDSDGIGSNNQVVIVTLENNPLISAEDIQVIV